MLFPGAFVKFCESREAAQFSETDAASSLWVRLSVDKEVGFEIFCLSSVGRCSATFGCQGVHHTAVPS